MPYSLTTSMCNSLSLVDEVLLSISPAGGGQLVKMLTTLEPYDIFGSNVAYLFMITLSSHWFAKWRRGLAEHQFGRSRSFCENAHNA